MKKEILSLKSLYRFLVINDYPTYSEGIIRKNNHTGLTLTKFWQDNLLIDFRKHKCGKIIWRLEGGRNRYISEICNRSDRLHFYGEYAEEIYSEAKPETVFRQIRQFMSFLLERQFSFDAFMKKLPSYMELLTKSDEFFTKDVAGFFKENLKKQKEYRGKRSTEQAFFCGWFLTFFMIHALAGNGEGEAVLQRLRSNPDLSLENIEKSFWQSKEKKPEKVIYLSGKNTELCSTPLDARHFFGREEELFEFREMLERGGRYLVSGIGGIGKTELMRQFIKRCEEEVLTDYICVVQYENNLVDSLIKAFPQIHGRDREENFYGALAIIRMHAGERILIVIDNMNRDQEEDEDIKILSKIPATIFVTSRYQKLNDFETYQVKAISKKAGSLIFRDNYRMQLQEEDKQALEEILDSKVWCHTLTLRLLGSVAGSRGLSLQKLLEQMEKGISPTGLKKQDGYEGLRQIYQQMYAVSGLPGELNNLLKIFAVLPYASYTLDFAQRFLSGYLSRNSDMQKSLEQLWISGWLEKRDSGYSMHPFIAECVNTDTLQERDIAPFFESVLLAWEEYGIWSNEEYLFYNWQGDVECIEVQLRLATLSILSVVEKVIGKMKEQYVILVCFAAMGKYFLFGPSNNILHLLMRIKERSREITDSVRIYLYCALAHYGYNNLEELEKEYREQFKNLHVSENLRQLYASMLALLFFRKGKTKQSEEISEYLWTKGDRPVVRMCGCLELSRSKLLKGDIDGYYEWTKKGVEFGRNNLLENTEEMYALLCNLCSYYLTVKKIDEAEGVLNEIGKLCEKSNQNIHRLMQLYYQGSLELNRGDAGYGKQALAEACKLAEALYTDTVHVVDYAMMLGELALACNKADCREEASEYYKKELAILKDVPGREIDIHRTLNNMGVMYLEWEKPKEALDYLTKAWEIGKTMGGLPAAENANNLSRAWRMLGDREKELTYLKEAVPVLEQFYGSDNPKVVDAKKRLSE